MVEWYVFHCFLVFWTVVVDRSTSSDSSSQEPDVPILFWGAGGSDDRRMGLGVERFDSGLGWGTWRVKQRSMDATDKMD